MAFWSFLGVFGRFLKPKSETVVQNDHLKQRVLDDFKEKSSTPVRLVLSAPFQTVRGEAFPDSPEVKKCKKCTFDPRLSREKNKKVHETLKNALFQRVMGFVSKKVPFLAILASSLPMSRG